jgi:hypothetical protein
VDIYDTKEREGEMSGKQKVRMYQSSRIAVIATVCLLVLPVFLSGCIEIEPAVDKALEAVDRAINRLEGESADWRTVLKDLKDDLPADVQSTIKHEVSDVTTRAIASTGAEVKCSEEFMREQVLNDLYRIRARLTGETIPSREPRVCHTVPEFLDAALVPDRQDHLSFIGYNLETSGLEVLLQTGDTTFDVSAYLDRPSHYELTVNLGRIGVPLGPFSRRFILMWNDEEIYTVGISPAPVPEPVRHTFRISGIVDVNDDDWGDDDHNTFFVDWSVTLTPEQPNAVYRTYREQWCVDEVRGEMEVSISLDASTGKVFGNGVTRTYEATSGSCGGNDLDRTDTFNFELNPGELYFYYEKLEDAGDYADFELTFENIKG